jgi:hypothetical protein
MPWKKVHVNRRHKASASSAVVIITYRGCTQGNTLQENKESRRRIRAREEREIGRDCSLARSARQK